MHTAQSAQSSAGERETFARDWDTVRETKVGLIALNPNQNKITLKSIKRSEYTRTGQLPM